MVLGINPFVGLLIFIFILAGVGKGVELCGQDRQTEVCCRGKPAPRTGNSTCCCGNQTFSADKFYCCKGNITKRPPELIGVNCCTCGLSKSDVVFLMDSSESLSEQNFYKMKYFMMDIVESIEDDDTVRVGSVSFSHLTYINFYLDEYKSGKALVDAISKIPHRRGSTDTASGIKRCREDVFVEKKGDRPDVDNILIIMTDGTSDDHDDTVKEAQLARDAGIRIVVIGIGVSVGEKELNLIASPPSNVNVHLAKNFDVALKNIESNLFASTCTDVPIGPPGSHQTTTTSSVPGTTGTYPYGGIQPKGPPTKCKCFDATGIQKDVDQILNKLDDVLEQGDNLTVLPSISSKLSVIQEAVQDKTCQCENSDMLLEVEEKTLKTVNSVLQLANESNICACNNDNTKYGFTKIIFDKLDKLKELLDVILGIVKGCDEDMAEIKDKFDKIIEKEAGNGTCDISQLEQDNVYIRLILQEIFDKVHEILRDRGCGCKEELEDLNKKLCDKIDLILEKIDNITRQLRYELEYLKNALENMDKKLDKIIEKDTTAVIDQCNCITYNQFITILPLYCVKQQREKKVQPWELTEEGTERILGDYESCIKVAIHDLDKWFKPGTWNKMAETVKKVMITMYCKMGFKTMKYFFKSQIKAKLEAGNWKEAAKLLRKTLWAKRDSVTAEQLIKKLEEVQ